MGMPAVEERRWTIEEVERLMEQREGYTPRYELVDGELLVTPAPSNRHQRIAGRLYLLLHQYVERHHLGEAFFSPGDVRLTSATHLEPDVYVVPLIDGRRLRAIEPVPQLSLAAEVLSPSSARHDRITKRIFFQKHGLPEYWVVDGETEAFEIWHPTDERALLADETVIWHPDGALDPLVIDIKRFFADVADDK